MHLACLADDASACRELRRRKQRDEKPFAVMCRSVGLRQGGSAASRRKRSGCWPRRKSHRAAGKRERGAWAHLSENNCIGVMLPYTPLHVLLMGDDIDCLVMTSANISDTPIVYKNTEALERLSGIADGFLLHDREIVTRCDDSLVRIARGREYPAEALAGLCALSGHHARAGGGPAGLRRGAEGQLLLSKSGHAFPSQHIGDLKNAETLAAYEGQIAHFVKLLTYIRGR